MCGIDGFVTTTPSSGSVAQPRRMTSIIYRKKMGFPTPIRSWLLDPKAEPLYAALLSPDGFLAQV
jgi:hypothetical protein